MSYRYLKMSSVISLEDQKEKHNEFHQVLYITPCDILCRICESFVPPFKERYQKVHVDFVGPLVGALLLTSLVVYGNSFKLLRLGISPVEFISVYSVLMPTFCFSMGKMGQSTITFYETLTLIGYSYYGHFLTLLVSFICYQEESNIFFFECLVLFGGMSTLRLVLVFLKTIPIPALRLLICASISILNILFLVFLHFAFMHRTYVYKGIE